MTLYFGADTDSSSYVLGPSPNIDIKIVFNSSGTSINFYNYYFTNGVITRSVTTPLYNGFHNLEIIIYSYLSTSGITSSYTTTVDIYDNTSLLISGSVITSSLAEMSSYFKILNNDSTYNIDLYLFKYIEYYKENPTEYITAIVQ